MKKVFLILVCAALALVGGCKDPKPQYNLVADFIKAVSVGDVAKVRKMYACDEADPEDRKVLDKLLKATKEKDILKAVSTIAITRHGITQSGPMNQVSLQFEFCTVYAGQRTATLDGGGTVEVPDYKLCAFKEAGVYEIEADE